LQIIRAGGRGHGGHGKPGGAEDGLGLAAFGSWHAKAAGEL